MFHWYEGRNPLYIRGSLGYPKNYIIIELIGMIYILKINIELPQTSLVVEN